MKKVGLISLGCPRNLVDSEIMLGSLRKGGFAITELDRGVDVCVVNTCSFIGSAKQESIDTILEAAELKKEGRIGKLVVSGCLSQLAKGELLEEIPEIDLVLGTSDYPNIGSLLSGLGDNRSAEVSDKLTYLYDEDSPRFTLTPSHYAYVKISEGCSNHCSYCIISSLRGNFRSRAIESITEEIGRLSADGILKEVNLIGQDTTLCGLDRYGKEALPFLLKRICAMKNSVKWVRVLYTHPAHYSDDFVSTIAGEEKICKYLDLPIQHISDTVLAAMNRRTTKSELIGLIRGLRKNIKGLALRTSVIVGFPGETERDFKELLVFVRETRFERLGAFIYSREAGTRAAGFKEHVPEDIKEARLDELMKLQKSISADVNRSFLKVTMEVLIDEPVEGEVDKFLGRSSGDAPEVDGTVYVTGRGIKVGELYNVKIKDTLEYDLVGDLLGTHPIF